MNTTFKIRWAEYLNLYYDLRSDGLVCFILVIIRNMSGGQPDNSSFILQDAETISCPTLYHLRAFQLLLTSACH
jgi:hypothetical protein